MPKPTKKTVEWFPHSVKHGRKMLAVERRFGNDGYATWFKLLEELGEAENHCLLLTCPHQIDLMSARCFVEPDRFLQIVEALVSYGEFNREIWENHRAIFSQKLVDSVHELYRKRRAAPPCIDSVAASLGTLADPAEIPPEPANAPLPKISDYSDIYAHHPILVAQAITGETEATNPKGIGALRKYLRILSKGDPARGVRMFREVLRDVWGGVKAGEISNPAANLNKKLKELTQ